MHKYALESYRDLVVWQKAKILAVDLYKQTAAFPNSEIYGLTSQVRRSAVSIAANIAEGYGRHSKKDYIRFLRISKGSLFELQTLLDISRSLDYIDENGYRNQYDLSFEIEKMLNTLISKLEKAN